jgi:hypothetical protein
MSTSRPHAPHQARRDLLRRMIKTRSVSIVISALWWTTVPLTNFSAQRRNRDRLSATFTRPVRPVPIEPHAFWLKWLLEVLKKGLNKFSRILKNC